MFKHQPVKSSNLESIAHDKESGVLQVKFRGTGKVFNYNDVDEKSFNDMLNADSVGSHFAKHVRGCKECSEHKADK